MSQTLTIQLSDETFASLKHAAQATGTTPAELASGAVEQRFCEKNDGTRSQEAMEAARKRFEAHFGEVDLGYATGLDNESIDADLAREYADDHRGE